MFGGQICCILVGLFSLTGDFMWSIYLNSLSKLETKGDEVEKNSVNIHFEKLCLEYFLKISMEQELIGTICLASELKGLY